jgi:hypothetical protein
MSSSYYTRSSIMSGRRSRRPSEKRNGSSVDGSDPKQSTETMPSTPYTSTLRSATTFLDTSVYANAAFAVRGAEEKSSNRPLGLQISSQQSPVSSMDNSHIPAWLLPFDESRFRRKWLANRYNTDGLEKLLKAYFHERIASVRPEAEWTYYQGTLKRAFLQGQSKLPEYKAKACDDAVRVFQEAHSKPIN